MRARSTLAAAWLAVLAVLPAAAQVPAGQAFTYSGVLQVDDAAAAAERLSDSARALGGWFVHKSTERLELRVPAGRARAFWDALPSHGVLSDQNLASENLAPRLADLEARLRARRESMERYLALLQSASDTSLADIERALSAVQREIDAAEGEKRVLEDRLAFARVSLHLVSHQRTAPLPTGRTRFPWLNALGLQNLLNRFGYGHAR